MSSLCCGNLYETAQSALAKNDLKCLNELYSRLLVDVRPMFTNEQLLDRIYDPDHTLCRNFGAEIYVPKHAHDGKTCTAIRTLKNYQRSTMVGERLNGLALMQIHQEIVPDIVFLGMLMSPDMGLNSLVCIQYSE
ncbi:uncharacterized protein LOC124451721 [Xenia sp. Carnegie-2017]|uniref:uncharacterized protein LOC124451721 n=1 Tax=Xenia sp. Carnegie-2017 TaxID=2897299 RepID=UPI001F033F8C|nr:uncharacterized protein LOC124446508 isoform X2 [Xenia sp. Carnegie-2017]XP_046858301.1 uncharacterized protein LOC124451721 [Xenia sp. Carnegie-2017]